MQHKNASQFNPVSSRPDMPGYGLLEADQGRGLLPWQWARERLEKAQRYWVATTWPDGRPHVTAVWGIWWENVFYFSTGRLTRKARNFAQNQHCVVCTESAAEAVIVEGAAELVGNPASLNWLASAYAGKYGDNYPDDSFIYAVRPVVAFGFIESEEEFAGSATRWHF